MERIFKVGMKVWDDVAFPGTLGFVTTTDKDSDYSMGVNFKGTILDYTPEGRIDKTLQPTLSVVPYEFKLPEQIVQHEFKKYDRVLVRDLQSAKWDIDVFKEYDPTYVTQPFCCYRFSWKYCIPFDAEVYENQ